MRNSDECTRWQVVYTLKSILAQAQMAGVVTALKDYLSDEIRENEFGGFHDCHKVIWCCAQNLLYPDFYQAGHQASIHQRE
jgi:hypothetical protein